MLPVTAGMMLGNPSRALSTSVLHRGGLTVRSGAKTGVVTAIQRFGSNLALNVHLHMLVPDGAYTFEHDRPRFHRIPAPSHEHLQQLLDALIARITRTLVRAGALIEDPLAGEAAQPYLDLEPDSPSTSSLPRRTVTPPDPTRANPVFSDASRAGREEGGAGVGEVGGGPVGG